MILTKPIRYNQDGYDTNNPTKGGTELKLLRLNSDDTIHPL